MTFRVVTPAKWLADDLGGVYDLGLDLRGTAENTWWCSTRFAARLLVSGVNPWFQSAGPRWLTGLPKEFTKRSVLWAGSLRELAKQKHNAWGHYKLAEAKSDKAPAMLGFRQPFVWMLTGQKFPADTNVQYSSPLEFEEEFRCFVARGKVLTVAPYLNADGVTWDEWPEDTDGKLLHQAEAFCQDVVSNVQCPEGFVVDVGVTAGQEWAVVEPNAAWSSNPYSCNLEAVRETIEASQHDAGSSWLWSPDPYEAQFARPLTLAR